MTLATLRAAGFGVAAVAPDRLVVTPGSRLTSEQRGEIRMHKHEILRELADEAVARQEAIVAARDAAALEEWRAALILGRLQLCANCVSFAFGLEPAGRGTCARHGQGLLPWVPFECSNFGAAEAPAAADYLPNPGGRRAMAGLS